MLTIKNIDRITGESFVDGRFLCTNHIESGTSIRFQFLDTETQLGRYVWIEINRNKTWANDSKNPGWYYKLNYAGMPAEHKISADWFSDFDNARYTFETALKNYI